MATGLAIGAASLVTSARIAWARELLRNPWCQLKFMCLFQEELEGGSEVVTGTAPILGFEASVLFDSGATHSFVSIVFIRLSRLVVRTLEPGLAVTTPCRENCGL
jgi:hypothetical protein